MKRTAQPDYDKEQPPRQQQRTEAAFVFIGTKEEVPLGTTDLDLRIKRLTTLPESIGKLRALTRLNLTGNRLKELPAAIGSLAALTTLYVDRNQLTELPAAIGSLTALTTLSVIANQQLKELPAEIGSLTALTMLNVHSNQLTKLPATIGSLAALTGLYVSSNQLTCGVRSSPLRFLMESIVCGCRLRIMGLWDAWFGHRASVTTAQTSLS